MGMVRWGLIVPLLVAGCSSSHHAAPRPPRTTTAPEITEGSTSAPVRASVECRQAVGKGYTFVNAQATTVGAIHAIPGPARGTKAWSNIFPGYPPNAFAAWCW